MKPGDRVADRYLVEEEIGQGGMARIFKALDERTGKPVAIKEVSIANEASPSFAPLEWFKREVKALMHLDHPSIVRLVDHGGFDTPSPFFVMEFLRGRDFQSVVDKNGPLPENVLVAVAVKLLSALAAAHEADVIHRDLKPANVILCDDGRVVLIDFGLARATNTDAGSTLAKSLNTRLIGTPQFYSPEQLEGVALSAVSDLFSLGASLYFLASRHHAFAANNALDTIRAIAFGKRASLAVDAPSLSAGVRDAIESLLAHAPADRPQSARDALSVFHGFVTMESEGALVTYAAQRLAGAPVGDTLVHIDPNKTEIFHDTQVGVSATQVQTRPSSQKTVVAKATTRRPVWLVGVVALVVAFALMLWPKRKAPEAPVAAEAPVDLPLPTIPPAPRPPEAVPVVPALQAEPVQQVVEHRDEKGTVVCELAQWAEITIDGKSYGKKQAAATFSLPAGKHAFVFANDRYGERKTTIVVRPNRTAEVLVDFVHAKP